MFRQRDWSSRLQKWAAAQQGKPFVWGSTDCAALARAALIEMFGEEISVHLPYWDNVRGAALILQARGSVGSILEELGAERTSVPFMRVGDLIVSAEPEEDVGHESVMVCIEGQKCLASTREGVTWSGAAPDSVVYSLWEVTVDG
jgi:hypothetical protein